MQVRWMVIRKVATLIVALIIGFFVYRSHRTVPPKAKAVVPAPVAPAPAPPAEIALTGTIQATKIVKVGPPIDGKIEQLIADVGDDVAKGDVLARIKNPKLVTQQEQARLEMEHARNRVQQLDAALIGARLEVSRADADAMRVQLEIAKAQKEYERQQVMMREGVTPRLTFEKAEREYNALKTQSENLVEARKIAAERVASLTTELEAARKTVTKGNRQAEDAPAGPTAGELASPVDGVVIARHGKEDDPVTTKATVGLFEIATDLGKLQAVAGVDAQASARIHAGQAATLEVKEFPITAQGTVREVKGGQMTIDFASPSPSVRPGMSVRIVIKF